MKRLLFLCTILLTIFGALGNTFASEIVRNLPKEFFDEHMKVVILEELESQGINLDASLTISDMEEELENDLKNNSKNQKILLTVKKLKELDYVYMSNDGEVYSSKRGYLGKAAKEEIKKENENVFATKISVLSMSNPIPSEIHGGDSGAFERKQLGFNGFDGIISNVTLPTISNVTTGEQPWVYYGFDSSQGGVEGGYAYQTGTNRWLPYIRNTSNGLSYAVVAYQKYNGNTINNFKFYIKKQSGATYYNAYLIDGATTVVFTSTPFTSASTVSVKRNTTIAKDGFNGTNIYTNSYNQKWDSVQVSKYNSDYYNTWSTYSEYSEWKNGKWYGTIDCISSYVKKSSGYTSIYK